MRICVFPLLVPVDSRRVLLGGGVFFFFFFLLRLGGGGVGDFEDEITEGIEVSGSGSGLVL